MSLFNPSRDEVRQFFFDAWAKFKAQQALSELETIAIQVVQMHPEYQPVLDAPGRYMEQAYFPEMGETDQSKSVLFVTPFDVAPFFK